MKKYEVIYKKRGKGIKEMQSIVVEAASSVEAVDIAREQIGAENTVRNVKLVREPKAVEPEDATNEVEETEDGE